MLINGHSADMLSVQDRGLLYGDGVFETILCEGGGPVLLAGHTQRLENGCKRLNLPVQELPTILSEVRQVAGNDDCIVKVIITRGVRSRGYGYDKQDDTYSRIVLRDDLPQVPGEYYQIGIRLTECHHRLPRNSLLAGIKHLNRLDQVMARSEWDKEFQEGVMQDDEGNVIEGTMTNIFIQKDSKWLTPKLENAGVAGVMRQWIMRNAYRANIECVEEAITIADMKNADSIFVCNSVVGIWPVTNFSGNAFSISPAVKQLMEYIHNNLSKFYLA